MARPLQTTWLDSLFRVFGWDPIRLVTPPRRPLVPALVPGELPTRLAVDPLNSQRLFQRAIESLKKSIVQVAGIVEENVMASVLSLETRDKQLAERVIARDAQVDRMEVEVEEECLRILAQYQPTAADLRFLVAVLKINNDLERIGDLAVNIAERVAFLATHDPIEIPFDLDTMALKTTRMVKMSLDALVNRDSVSAREVCLLDEEIDAINRDAYASVEQAILEHPNYLSRLMHLLSTARHLERIADLSTNIAEDVVYMVEGQIVRHRSRQNASLGPY